MEGRKIIVTCPHCRFSSSVDPAAIPEGVVNATCPKCRESFQFTGHVSPAPPMASGEFTATAGSPSTTSPMPAENHSHNAVDEPADSPTTLAGTPGVRNLRFHFQGKPGEYFGIWIVNTLLKIVTIGIYSAWAKVRKRRYFYGSTNLDGEQFEYLADPHALFKGWIIGATAFILYIIAEKVSPSLSMITGLAIFIALPWLVVRSRMFNARNSSYRNIRFSFRPEYVEAYLVFLGFPLLAPFTLGLLLPYVIFRQKKYLVENGSYGMTPFAFDATLKSFYLVFLRATLGAVALLVILFVFIFLAAGGVAGILGIIKSTAPKGVRLLSLLPLISFPLVYFCIATYVQTALTNLTWDGTTIADCRFSSTLRTRDMIWLYLSNAVAIACSFGLLTPWAAVRLARYRFERLGATTQKEPGEFFALARNEDISATGEEIGDIFGIDVDFGF